MLGGIAIIITILGGVIIFLALRAFARPASPSRSINAGVGISATHAAVKPTIAQDATSYPAISRLIDIGAFIVLMGGIYFPVARIAFRPLQLASTDLAIIFAGAAFAGLVAALARYRRIAVISALIYGGLFVFRIITFYEKMETASRKLKDNPFRGLFTSMVGLDWGCAVITIAVLAILCSTMIANDEGSKNGVRNS